MDRLAFYRLILLPLLCALCGVMYFASVRQFTAPGFPFGVGFRDGQTVMQDFSFHLNFCRQVWEGKVERPYTPAGQEKIYRAWAPEIGAGMPSAYSPTLLVLFSPFLLISARFAFLAWSLLNLLVLAWLVQRFLLPRIETVSQMRLLLLSLCSISLMICFGVGQTAIMTSAAIAFAWMALASGRRGSVMQSVELGLIFFAMTAKPNLALVLGCMFLAARAWVPCLIGGALALAAMLIFASKLGGWPIWLGDYLWFLNHYYPEGVGPFLAQGVHPRITTNLQSFLLQTLAFQGNTAALISKIVWLGSMACALGATWAGRLKLETFFALNFALFLLFCPNVSVSEDFALALLIATVPLFKNERWASVTLPLVLVAVNSLPGVDYEIFHHFPTTFAAKFVLVILGVATFHSSRGRNLNAAHS